jgi:hypothetical protein
MQTVKSAAFLALIMTLSFSCLDEPDCYQLNNNIVGITFKETETAAASKVDSVTITADGFPTTFLSNGTPVTVFLPLNYFAQSTSFTFQLPDTAFHLLLGHNSQAEFVSPDCGERYVLSGLTVIEHNMDSVRLINSTPGVKANVNNLEIFW